MNYALAAASGCLLVLLYPKFDIAILAPFALTPLLIAIAREALPLRRAMIGQTCGFVFWIGVCYWIRPVLIAYGGLNDALGWLALVLFAFAKGLHFAVFAWLAGHLIRQSWAIPAIAALWTGIERTNGTFGFAWLTLGNAGSEMSLPLRLAPFAGVYGLSFAFAMLASGLALLILRQPRRQLAPLIALPLLFLLPEMPPLDTAQASAVAVQPNLTQETPVDVNALAARSLVASVGGANLIAWPEVPSGLYWDGDRDFQAKMSALARDAQTPVLFAGVTRNASGAPLNSAILVGPDGREAGRYSKTFLVPFGEFIPPLFGWIEKISTEAGNFAPGDGPAMLGNLGVFICYEAAFPHLVRQFSDLGAEVLVNLSNDGWFFETSAREQHLLLARMRAAENRRWLLRVTNNGITASIDPAGRVAKTLPEFREIAGKLPYTAISTKTAYAAYGDWFAWSCLAVGLLSAAYGAIAIRGE